MTRRMTSEMEVKLAFWEYLHAADALSDTTVGDMHNVYGPATNALWQFDLRRAGCKLRLERRNAIWVVDLATAAEMVTVHILGTPAQAVGALQHMTQALNLLAIKPH